MTLYEKIHADTKAMPADKRRLHKMNLRFLLAEEAKRLLNTYRDGFSPERGDDGNWTVQSRVWLALRYMVKRVLPKNTSDRMLIHRLQTCGAPYASYIIRSIPEDGTLEDGVNRWVEAGGGLPPEMKEEEQQARMDHMISNAVSARYGIIVCDKRGNERPLPDKALTIGQSQKLWEILHAPSLKLGEHAIQQCIDKGIKLTT